ncbi:hypothetical protein ACH4OY_11610 [Micromonospora rubida]|uniref:MFS transporter n=1 Tax=Micromonospora rubida TaxID=2697657 RepID=A0ABW7SK91_9ACTN
MISSDGLLAAAPTSPNEVLTQRFPTWKAGVRQKPTVAGALREDLQPATATVLVASVLATAVVPAVLTALVADSAEDRERADNGRQPPAPRDTG